ncbi:hypothetical protein UY3_06922 [Chelonia mydas]|uniref:Uncharacterized protein n=1 Tax=Chelonia mydas TaxID=8469 RepID=M7BFC9_CHEMY|nr:hypothetical protein UY3_06922 [Chelonia mydas]
MVSKGRVLLRVRRGILCSTEDIPVPSLCTGLWYQPLSQLLATRPLANAVAVLELVEVSPGTGTPSYHSYSVVSERRATVSSCLELDPDSSTDPGIKVPEVALVEEEEAAPPPVQASSLSSLDETVRGSSNSLVPVEFRAHKEPLKRVTANLGLEVKELKESVHSLIDILAAVAPFKVALPVNEAVLGPARALW